MQTKIISGPSAFPVSLAEAKDHLNLSHSNDDDIVYSLTQSATFEAEQFLMRKLVTQTWQFFIGSFPNDDFITMPWGQLQSVSSLKYKDTDGTESTMDSGEYIVDINSDPGRIVLGYGESWPTDVLYPSNPIEIEFVCGYNHGPIWTVNTVKSLNNIVLPTMANQNGLAYKCSARSGDFKTHESVEPTWPVALDSTVVDDAITWTCTGSAIPESIRHTIKIMITDGYENRESIISGTIFSYLSIIRNLLLPYKIWEQFDD